MTQQDPTNGFAAFEILLEEVETEIESISRVGGRAFESRDFDRAKAGVTSR